MKIIQFKNTPHQKKIQVSTIQNPMMNPFKFQGFIILDFNKINLAKQVVHVLYI